MTKKKLLCILRLHLLVASRRETHIHKGIRLSSQQVGFAQVLDESDSNSLMVHLSWTYPPLNHPKDQVLGLVVVVDPVLEPCWPSRAFLGLGLLI